MKSKSNSGVNRLWVSGIVQGSNVKSIHSGKFHSFHLDLLLDCVWDGSLVEAPDAEENIDSGDETQNNNVENDYNTDDFFVDLVEFLLIGIIAVKSRSFQLISHLIIDHFITCHSAENKCQKCQKSHVWNHSELNSVNKTINYYKVRCLNILINFGFEWYEMVSK